MENHHTYIGDDIIFFYLIVRLYLFQRMENINKALISFSNLVLSKFEYQLIFNSQSIKKKTFLSTRI